MENVYSKGLWLPRLRPSQVIEIAMVAFALTGLPHLRKAQAESIPALSDISHAKTTTAAFPDLLPRRAALIAERSKLRTRTRKHNATCSSVVAGSPEDATCSAELATLKAERKRHILASREFNRIFLMDAMAVSGESLQWNPDERTRLHAALKKLSDDGDPAVTGSQIRQTWQDVLARGAGEAFAREASKGAGPGFPGAGAQTVFQDCAVFALANAAGVPYGVAAARAAKLIAEGEWRSAAERGDPQKVIEQEGLMGGEVVILAEALGQVKVVPSSQFRRVLQEGHPVMVNVVPQDGDVNAGHEVVLTKAFTHAGQAWYEMMDSNQGPRRRLYLSAGELAVVLQESGVVFRPEFRTVPTILRPHSTP